MAGSIRVLYVDDEPDYADLAAEYLERQDEDVEVVTAYSAEAGLERLSDASFDCVVSDYEMPRTNGLEFLDAVRSRYGDLPFILATGRGSEGIAAEAISAGVTDYIPKQRGTDQYAVLANRVANAVDRYRSERDAARSERYRQQLYELTADTGVDDEETIERILAVGREFLDLENGHVAEIDRDRSRHEVVEATGSDLVSPGSVTDLDETFCCETMGSGEVLAVFDAGEGEWADHPASAKWEIGRYIGSELRTGGELFGTVCFVDRDPRLEPFSAVERSFVEFVARLISHILERREHLRTLRAEKEQFQLMVEAVEAYAIFRLDPDGCITTWNTGAERIKGYSEDEILGEHFSVFYPEQPTQSGKPDRLLQEAVEAGTVTDEGWRLRKDGSRFWANVAITALYDEAGALTGFTKVTRDMTKRREQERRRERIVERVTDGIIEVDADWCVTLVNDEAAALTHLDQGSSVGRDFWELFETARGSRFGEEYRGVMETRDPTSFVEYDAGLDGWFEVDVYPNDDGGLSMYFSEITERRERERRFEAIFDNAFTFTGLLDPDGTVLEVNRTALESGGVEAGDVVGKPLWETEWFQLNDDTRETAREAVAQARDGRLYREEVRFKGSDDVAVVDFSLRPVTNEQGEVTLLIPEARDITERVRQEARIAGLNGMLADFLTANEMGEIADIFVEAAATSLDLPVTVLALFDETTGRLEPTAATHAATERVDVEAVLDGEVAWDVYADAEPAEMTGPAAADVARTDDIERLAIRPLGRHGVFLTALEPADVGGPTEDFLETVANSLRDALTRIDREALLEAREAELAERNEQLTKVNRINRFIRSIDRALVTATSTAEIYRTVCEELADDGPYSLAWIGTYDAATNEVVPAADAGDEAEYLDAVAVDHDGENPTALAARTRAVQVIENLRTEPPYRTWRERALARGYRSVVALPIVYRDRIYGVLTLYTSDPDLVADVEREVLGELVTNLANAVSAVRSQRALVSESVVELDLAIDASRVPLLTPFVQQPGATVNLEAVVPAADGDFRVFFSTTGVDGDTLAGIADTSLVITDHAPVGSDRYEFVVTDESLVGWLLDQGVTPHSLSADGESATLVVTLAGDEAVREFVESFEARYGDVTLRSRQERERTPMSSADFRARLVDQLTARQQEILHVAYAGGYFDSPRGQTGSEIAETLGISQPTFSDHLRRSQRTLLELLFESDDATLTI